MANFEGESNTIDLDDMHPSDFFKIGVAHAEQNVHPPDPTYAVNSAYLEGYAFGMSMKPYLYTRRDYA